MNALDTNVLVRYLTRDNPEQAEAARARILYTPSTAGYRACKGLCCWKRSPVSAKTPCVS